MAFASVHFASRIPMRALQPRMASSPRSRQSFMTSRGEGLGVSQKISVFRLAGRPSALRIGAGCVIQAEGTWRGRGSWAVMAAQPDTGPPCPPSLRRARPLSALSLGPPLPRPPTNSCGAWAACAAWPAGKGGSQESCSGDLWLERQLW